MPIFALPFVLSFTDALDEGLDMKFLLRQVWSCLIEQVILFTFKKRSSQIPQRFWTQNSWSGFPGETKTMHWVLPKLSDLQMNETSNFLFDRLECIMHLPLSPARPLHRVFPKLSGHTVVKSAFFVTLHLRDQNLQCFPRNRRNASAMWM